MAEQVSQEIREKAGRVIGEMLAKAIQDEEFRKLALQDFSAAYKAHSGKDLPEGTNIRIVEAGQGNPEAGLYEIPNISDELSDEDLEQVAGGVIVSAAVNSAVMAYGVMPPTIPSVTQPHW